MFSRGFQSSVSDTSMERGATMKLGFVCVQNAGRSQVAMAFAEHERDERGLEDIELEQTATGERGVR